MNLSLCACLALISMALGDLSPFDYALPGNIDDWPELKALGEFANNIDRFTKITELFVIITKDDRVYVFGNQTIGTSFDAIDGDTGPQPIEVKHLSGKKIVRFEFFEKGLVAFSEDESFWNPRAEVEGRLRRSFGLYSKYSGHIIHHREHPSKSDLFLLFASKGLKVRDKAHPISFAPIPCDHKKNPEKVCQRPNTHTIEDMSNVVSSRLAFEDSGLIYVNLTEPAHLVRGWSVFNRNPDWAPLQEETTFVPVDLASARCAYFILSEDGQVYRREGSEKYNPNAHVKPFYQGPIKFQQLYADLLSHPSYLVGRTRDGELYVLEDVNEVRALNTTDIVAAFATDHPAGYLPFMVKLDARARELEWENPKKNDERVESCVGASHLLANMFNNHDTSDTKFEVGNETINVHRSILVSSSAFMSTQFAGPWRSKSSVKVLDYTYEVYNRYLRFLYTDRLQVNKDVALDLYVLASNLNEESLKERCLQILLTNTNNI